MNATLFCARWLLAVLLGAWLAGCGGGSSADTNAQPAPPLRLESAAAVTQTIGPAGGTLATTGADGTTYTLTVPAKALRRQTALTLTPIATIADLPARVTLAGGAHLAPEGHRFDVPLTLSIALAAAPAAAPLPFAYDGELQQRHRYPATVNGRTIAFEIVHFSGYAALSAVLGDALGFFPAPSDRGDRALQELVDATLLGLAPAARAAALRNALQGWLDEFIKPEVAALAALSSYDLDAFMTGRVARLATEMKTFAIALKFALLQTSTTDGFATLQYEFRFEVALAARDAIDLSTAGCSMSPDQAVLLIAPDILAWQQLAKLTDAVAIDASLQRPAVLRALCVKPVYDPQDGVSLSAGIQPGQTGLLTVRAGYSINAGPARFDLPMLIATAGTTNVSPSALDTFDIGAGQTHAQPFQWHPATTELRIDVSACFAEGALTEVCTPAFVVRGTAAVSIAAAPATITLSPGSTARLSASVTGTLDTAVTWSASGGTITADGLYTAGQTAGTFQAIVTSVADRNVRATVSIAIVNFGAVYVGSLRITGSPSAQRIGQEFPVGFVFSNHPPGTPQTMLMCLTPAFVPSNRVRDEDSNTCAALGPQFAQTDGSPAWLAKFLNVSVSSNNGNGTVTFAGFTGGCGLPPPLVIAGLSFDGTDPWLNAIRGTDISGAGGCSINVAETFTFTAAIR